MPRVIPVSCTHILSALEYVNALLYLISAQKILAMYSIANNACRQGRKTRDLFLP